MTAVLDVPNTNTSVVDGPDGSGHGFGIGLTCPVAAADTIYWRGAGGANGAYIGAGCTDMVNVGPPRIMNAYWHGWSTGWYDPFPGAPRDGGSAAYAEYGSIGWSPNFSLGSTARPLGTLTPVCQDNAEFSPFTPLQGYTGPSAYILGGSECYADAHVITLNSSTGNQSITGLNLGGGAPDFLMFFGCCPWVINNTRDGTNGMIGVAGYDEDGPAGGVLKQWVGCTRSRFFDGGGNRRRLWHDDACIASMSETQFAGATTANQLASIVSMDTDGYTINLSQAGLDTSGVASKVIVLAVRVVTGGGITVGNDQQGATTLTAGFAPTAMMFASSQNTSLGSPQSTAYFQLGCMDAVSERSFWEGCNNGIVTSEAYVSTVSSIRYAQTGGTVNAEANATLTGTGANLNWTTDDSSGMYFGWVAFDIDFVKHTLPGCVQDWVPMFYRRP